MSQLFAPGGQSTGVSMDMSLNKLWETVKGREAWRARPWAHQESATA